METETNNMPKKKKILYVTLAVATIGVIIALLYIFVFSGKKSYRMIKVIDIENTSMVNRKGAGEFEAFVGVLLENGDHVDTQSDGKLYLELDGDKHIVAEPKTIFDIELAGKADLKDAKTKIVLAEGVINSVIDKPLMEGESYEIETPTGTMAVRGTEFLTTAGMLEGEKYAEVQVTKGVVEIYRPNDEKAGTVSVEAGKMLIVKESDELLSELVPWGIGEEPPVNATDEDNDENVEEETAYYDFGFSFEDFKFDGKTIDAGTFATIMSDYNVTRPITAGAGEAFSTEDGNINVTYLTEVPNQRYISWKTTGEYWDTLAIEDSERNEVSYTYDSTYQEAELRSHFSAPIKEGVSIDSLLEGMNVTEDMVNGEVFLCSLSDGEFRAYKLDDYIEIREIGEKGRRLNITFKDGVVTGFRLSFRI